MQTSRGNLATLLISLWILLSLSHADAGAIQPSLPVGDSADTAEASDAGAVPSPLKPGDTCFAMNCGGEEVIAQDSSVFQANDYSDPRSSSRFTNRVISGVTDPDLYKSWETSATKLIYALPVQNGYYAIDLYWAPLPGANGDNATEFDVSVDGRLVLDNFSPYIEAGQMETAVSRTFNVTVRDGELRLVLFRGLKGDPFINALRIRKMDPEHPLASNCSLSGVLGETVALQTSDFTQNFFCADGFQLEQVRFDSIPRFGQLLLSGQPVVTGQVIPIEELPNLLYSSALVTQGFDTFLWSGFDGNEWSINSPVTRIFMRQSENFVSPLISASWDTFEWPLFAYYPEGEQGQFNVVQGPDGIWRDGNSCGPTAKSHIMNYWAYPIQPDGDLSFSDYQGNVTSLNFPQTQYNYSAMPQSVTGNESKKEYAQVAKLFADNHYATVDIWNTGADTWEHMMPYGGFDGAGRVISLNDIGEAAWIAAIKNELNHGRPLMVSGNSDHGGHWWLVDGYNSSGQVHAKLNFGRISGYFSFFDMAGYKYNLITMVNMQPKHKDLISLSAPVGSPLDTTLTTGDPIVIEWAAPNSEQINLEYSLNGGANWTMISNNLDANISHFEWILPGETSDSFCLRILDSFNTNIYAESGYIKLVEPIPEYTVSLLPTEHGQLQLDPHQLIFKMGDTVQVHALADPGYHFAGWSAGLSGTDNPSSIHINEDLLIGALFEKDPGLYDFYAEWIAAQSVELMDAAPESDPDNDHFSNLIEYILAEGDPVVPQNLMECVSTGDGTWEIQIVLRDSIPADWFQVQVSIGSASEWQNAAEREDILYEQSNDRVTIHWTAVEPDYLFRLVPAEP